MSLTAFFFLLSAIQPIKSSTISINNPISKYTIENTLFCKTYSCDFYRLDLHEDKFTGEKRPEYIYSVNKSVNDSQINLSFSTNKSYVTQAIRLKIYTSQIDNISDFKEIFNSWAISSGLKSNDIMPCFNLTLQKISEFIKFKVPYKNSGGYCTSSNRNGRKYIEIGIEKNVF